MKMGLKDKLYNYFVCSNPFVRYEYERYVQEHIEEHYTNRFKQWKILFQLRKHYIHENKSDPLLFWDNGCLDHLLSKTETNLEKDSIEAASVTTPEEVPKKIVELESDARGRTTAYSMAVFIMQYDVISFDVFDTLVLRKLNQPEDIFLTKTSHT